MSTHDIPLFYRSWKRQSYTIPFALSGSNYLCLEQISMVRKMFEPLKFDCSRFEVRWLKIKWLGDPEWPENNYTLNRSLAVWHILSKRFVRKHTQYTPLALFMPIFHCIPSGYNGKLQTIFMRTLRKDIYGPFKFTTSHSISTYGC